MSLTNSEYEWELLKALLSDPYNPEQAFLLRTEDTDFTIPNRPYFRILRETLREHGCLDAGAFIELAVNHDVDPAVRTRLLELQSETYNIDFPLSRMAENLVRLKNQHVVAAKMEKAIKGPLEALETAMRDGVTILEGGAGLSAAPTLAKEWAGLQAGTPLVDTARVRPLLRFGLPTIDGAIQTGAGNMGVIAAKPSAGKSSLALQAALKTAQDGIGVMFLGLEMPRVELAARAIAWELDYPSFDLVRGSVPQRMDDPPKWINNLYVYDRIPKGAFDEAAAMIRKASRQGIKTVIVDYWTLIYPPDSKVRGAGTAYLLGEMSRGFKQLARELQIHIVLVSQFNREIKDAERPGLENLRETGQLEQDASWVVMLWNVAKEYGPYDNRQLWVELMKNRGGPRWVKTCTQFNPANGRFYETEAPATEAKRSVRGVTQ